MQVGILTPVQTPLDWLDCFNETPGHGQIKSGYDFNLVAFTLKLTFAISYTFVCSMAFSKKNIIADSELLNNLCSYDQLNHP